MNGDGIKEEIKDQLNSVVDITKAFFSSYKLNNSWKLRLLDSFLVYNFILLVLQMIYMLLVGRFPKNSFLSGVICCIGLISLTGRFFIQLV